MTDNELLSQILDGLKNSAVDSAAMSELAERASSSPDAKDYFRVLAGDPRLMSLCGEALEGQLARLREQHDSLSKAVEEQRASLTEAKSLLHDMQIIPTIVSREQLKQMVLLVMLQHGAREAV